MKNTKDKKVKGDEEEVKTVEMFCANEQAVTDHKVDVDDFGEIVITCACGRFTKLPAETNAKQLKAYLEDHQFQNEGQVSRESLDKKKSDRLKALDL